MGTSWLQRLDKGVALDPKKNVLALVPRHDHPDGTPGSPSPHRISTSRVPPWR